MARAPVSEVLPRSKAQRSQQRNRAAVGENGTSGKGAGNDREGASLRGSSTATPGARATPQVVSGPCARDVVGIIEFLG